MFVDCTECGAHVNINDKAIAYLGLDEAVYCDACMND